MNERITFVSATFQWHSKNYNEITDISEMTPHRISTLELFSTLRDYSDTDSFSNRQRVMRES